MSDSLLYDEIISCRKCPRLVNYRESVKENISKTANYWKKPVPGFGDLNSKILIVGLAPSAQGGNRTGRVFTGDKSGAFLFKSLYAAGLSNRPVSEGPGDGLELTGVYITAVVKCAPPNNMPTDDESLRCSSLFLMREIKMIEPRTIIVLGGFAFKWTMITLDKMGYNAPRGKFAHGTILKISKSMEVICSFHPSPQNTNTRRLTEKMFLNVLENAKKFALQT
ncbi:MAG: uracil-DNA glycosylase [Conexivisphaerales archaeon]